MGNGHHNHRAFDSTLVEKNMEAYVGPLRAPLWLIGNFVLDIVPVGRLFLGQGVGRVGKHGCPNPRKPSFSAVTGGLASVVHLSLSSFL